MFSITYMYKKLFEYVLYSANYQTIVKIVYRYI